MRLVPVRFTESVGSKSGGACGMSNWSYCIGKLRLSKFDRVPDNMWRIKAAVFVLV